MTTPRARFLDPIRASAIWSRLAAADRPIGLLDLIDEPRCGSDLRVLSRWEKSGLLIKAATAGIPSFMLADAVRGMDCPIAVPVTPPPPPTLADRLAAMPRLPGESGPERAWRALRLLRGAFTARELRSHGLPVYPITACLDHWQRLGLVERLPVHSASFSMTPKGRSIAVPPMPELRVRTAKPKIKPRDARARMWTAIRILKHFDGAQLGWAASVTPKTAAAFCGLLTRAGYLTAIDTKGGEPCWRLGRRPLGPQPPTISHHRAERASTLFDPNTQARIRITRCRSFFLGSELNHDA